MNTLIGLSLALPYRFYHLDCILELVHVNVWIMQGEAKDVAHFYEFDRADAHNLSRRRLWTPRRRSDTQPSTRNQPRETKWQAPPMWGA